MSLFRDVKGCILDIWKCQKRSQSQQEVEKKVCFVALLQVDKSRLAQGWTSGGGGGGGYGLLHGKTYL